MKDKLRKNKLKQKLENFNEAVKAIFNIIELYRLVKPMMIAAFSFIQFLLFFLKRTTILKILIIIIFNW